MKLIKQTLISLICLSLLNMSVSYAEQLKRSFAWPLQVGQLDPHNNFSDTLFSLISHYLSPLLKISPNNRITPGLAKSWTISDDSRTITLNLRQNAYWSDGVLITAQQAKQSIERALSPNMQTDAQLLLFAIEGAQEHINGQKDVPLGISTPDKHTLVFKLSHKDPDFLRSLAFPIASPVPMHQIDPDTSAYPSVEKISSSGPYRLIHTDQYSATFVVNQQYYGKQPHFKKVSFNFTEYKALIKNFLNKSYDTLEYIPADQIPWLKKHMPESIEVVVNNGAFYLVMKHEDQGGFDHQLRKLILESIDSTRINEIMTRQLSSPMSELIPWRLSQPTPTQEPLQNTIKTIQQARLLLEKQGFSAEKPLKACINLHKAATNDSLFHFLRAHFINMHIHLVQRHRKKNDLQSLEPEEVCVMGIDGYNSRIKSEEEIILSFFIGGLFHPFLKNNSELNRRYKAMSQLTNLQERAKAIQQLENYLISQHYVKALYKTDLISLINQQRISNYTQSKTEKSIPLTQHLKP